MVSLLIVVIYLSFISLGLPDSLLGSAWPSMYTGFGVPVSYAGLISMTISCGTVISALFSDRLTKKFGAGVVTAVSVGVTAAALFGFSISGSFYMLILFAIPYGLGAGCVDAALNNFVALHYASRHMSWLHCMWGVGTTISPYVMGYALSKGMGWNVGYRTISILQVCLTAIIVFSLPLWKKAPNMNADLKADEEIDNSKPLKLKDVLAINGAKEIMLTFFCYCGLEQTVILWVASYLVLGCGIATETAAFFASMFFIGMTVGRGINGFLSIKFSDTFLIRLGQGIILFGAFLILLPLGNTVTLIALVIVGLGCAPIYPCVIHSTPVHFGAGKSQAVIGIEMASAYVGTTLMPPIFGLVSSHISIQLFPVYLLILLVPMVLMHETLVKKTNH